MVSNTPFPEMNDTGRRRFLGKVMAVVGSNCVIEPGAKIVGVKVPDGRYVPMGTILNTQKAADNLPKITKDYPFRKLNAGVVHVNIQLADGYNGKLPKEMASAGSH